MKVAMLSATSGWHTEQLQAALARRGHRSFVATYEGLLASLGNCSGPRESLTSDGNDVLDCDAVLARIIPHGSLEQIIYRVNALHWIEARGIPVMNSPRAIERSVDKFYTTALLAHAGLAVPETVVCENPEDAIAAVERMGDVVFKPLFGSMGRGMVRVSDPDTAFRVARAWNDLRAVFYVQRAIDHGGRDIRAFVVGDRMVGAIERQALPGDWRTNVARGGRPRAIDLPDAWKQMAVRAAQVVGADYTGVDLLPSRDGAVYVLEVNGIPGWQGLQEATGLDVAGEIVTRLEAVVCEGRSSPHAGSKDPASVQKTTSADIAAAAQLACLLEVGAPKPGNVSPGRPFHDVSHEDFIASAAAIGEPFSKVSEQRLGTTIKNAVDATRQWTRANTNLGMVLLMAPIAHAAASLASAGVTNESLRQATARVLRETTIDDARDVYAAIRTAAPGGLGDAGTQDVRNDPTVDLREAMRLAAHRDTIAREYVTDFEMTFATGVPAMERARADGLSWNDAIVESFLALLSSTPDTHIARRNGPEAAGAVSRAAGEVVAEGGVRTEAGRRALDGFDRSLRDERNLRNPGTTADLTAASLFVVLLTGGWNSSLCTVHSAL